ncbi:MAG: hypothetical protein ACYCXP_11485 [Leptospirillum sp.]|jgi:hypothetical protein|nr:hypothetical protein [Nitrospiraceae bacterium]
MGTDIGSNLNSTVNYIIIFMGVIGLAFLVGLGVQRLVQYEKVMDKKLPADRPKVDPWGYPIEESEKGKGEKKG